MSARVGQIIEVIEEVRNNYRSSRNSMSIHQIRIDAGHSVATRRGITNQSVIDKFVRQLRPDIKSASQFDSLLESWLLENSQELRDIVLRHKSDTKDEALIRNAFYKASEQDILLSEEFGLDANDLEFREGKEKLRSHLVKERNRHLVDLAKKSWLADGNGDIKCSICSFSFINVYGEIGEGYIEAHHTMPISEITANTIVKTSDIAPVCSNCHRIIHRYRPWLSVEEMLQIVGKHEEKQA
ncbi:HNH endonuclease [Caldithrix abyssi]|nr:HNH endonuclease [Caldithrix abyssi]